VLCLKIKSSSHHCYCSANILLKAVKYLINNKSFFIRSVELTASGNNKRHQTVVQWRFDSPGSAEGHGTGHIVKN